MISSRLDNGMGYAVRSYGNAVGYCALSIKLGTRDEGSYHSGIAHFLEHTLFKGTGAKSSAVINNTLERLGGELNAFTTKEEIVLHATVLKKDLEKAASLLLEIAFDAQFPEEEIEIEKGVVLDEIASYKDFPAEEIYDSFEELLFAGGDLSRPILGTRESVMAITSDELRRFRSEFFTPDRMTLTMVSPLPEERMKKMIRRLAATIQVADGKAAAPARRICSVPDADFVPFSKVVEKSDNQVNCVLGAPAPSLGQERERLATILLCNMLGGPASNSILGSVLRERHGWVYNVECNYTPYSDTGVAVITFGCDRANYQKCLKAVTAQLRKLQKAPLSERRVEAAKRQILGQNAIGMESGEAQCLSMGKSMMSFGSVPTDEQVTSKIMSVTADELHHAACTVFNLHRLSTLVFL